MIRPLVVGFFLCLTFSSVEAQRWAFDLWHDGRIVLESGDTIKGEVKYDLQQNVIQYNNQRGSIEAFTPRKVLFCEIFDKTVNQYRQFYSLPYSPTSGYKTPYFFELLAEGKITLLARERVENQTNSSPYYYGTYSRMVLVNNYFQLNENGEIVDFSTKRTDFMELMGKHASHITAYMKDHKLKLDNKEDLAKIITYYNSLFKTNK